MSTESTTPGDDEEFRSIEEADQIYQDIRRMLLGEPGAPDDEPLAMVSRCQAVVDSLDSDRADIFEGMLWPLDDPVTGIEEDSAVEPGGIAGLDIVDKRYVLVVEDDGFTAEEYGLALTSSGLSVIYAGSSDEALAILRRRGGEIFLVIVDIRMETGSYFAEFETVGGKRTGVVLAQEILEIAESVILIALTNSSDALDAAWFEANENRHFCSKRDYSPEQLAEYVRIYVLRDFSSVRCFIIHGHDLQVATDLQSLLKQSFGFAQVTILARERSRGLTVMEKLERYLDKAHFIFALFTPDDLVVKPTRAKRARQNVVFEFGYAIGLHGRKSGRVFFLCKDGVEIPSDLKGIISIDITNGIAAAEAEIRMELGECLMPRPSASID